MPSLEQFKRAKETAQSLRDFAAKEGTVIVSCYNDGQQNQCGFLVKFNVNTTQLGLTFYNNNNDIEQVVRGRVKEWMMDHAKEIKEIISRAADEAINAYARDIQKDAIEVLTIANLTTLHPASP